MARPTLYNEEILRKTQEYIDSCEDTEVVVEVPSIVTHTDPETKRVIQDVETIKKVKTVVNIPTIEGLAYFLRLDKTTLYDWRKLYSEFSYLIEDLLAKQAKSLINKGLTGEYNHTIAKVLLTKHGYTDKVDVTSKDEKLPTPLLANIPIVSNAIPTNNSDSEDTESE